MLKTETGVSVDNFSRLPPFSFTEVEPQLIKWWNELGIYHTNDKSGKPPYYILDMFPYPSGAGLHTGHVEAYTYTDIIARFMRMKGYNVLHPMGWDSFGFPTEDFARRNGLNPHVANIENTNHFREQLKMLGASYDWTRELDTSKPEYYKWTQWMFIKLFEAGLVYQTCAPVNWCTGCEMVISDEKVNVTHEGCTCAHCLQLVETQLISQWMFKTTALADDLINDLKNIDWPESTKEMQRNFIGKKDGYSVKLTLADESQQEVSIFTTDLQELYDATFIAVHPFSPILFGLSSGGVSAAVADLIKRTPVRDNPTTNGGNTDGVFTGKYLKNPVTGELLPVWVTRSVMMDGKGIKFGTASNIYLQNFANKNGITLMTRQLQQSKINDLLGTAIIVDKTFNMRDWNVSRQRYWGAPIPLIFCEKDGFQTIPEDQLPVMLPEKPTYHDKNKAPLAADSEFLNTICPCCGGVATREPQTLDTFVDSMWYFLRFADPHNQTEFASKEKLNQYLPVSYYMGGPEHATGHLIYARFLTKALHQLGILDFNEPVKILRHQGMIMATDGKKMSKSLGNVENPDDYIRQYGADVLRLFEMFLGPIDKSKPWNTNQISGIVRFINDVWNIQTFVKNTSPSDIEKKRINRLIYEITNDLSSGKINVAIAKFMTYKKEIYNNKSLALETYETFLKCLAPLAPFITEALWLSLGHTESIHTQEWPEVKENEVQTANNDVTVVVGSRSLTVPSSCIDDVNLLSEAVLNAKVKGFNPKYNKLERIPVEGKYVYRII